MVAALVTVPGLDGRMAVEPPSEVPGLLPQLLWITAGLAVLLGRATAARRLLLATRPLVALQVAARLAVPALQDHPALSPGWIAVLWLVPASLLAGAVPVAERRDLALTRRPADRQEAVHPFVESALRTG